MFSVEFVDRGFEAALAAAADLQTDAFRDDFRTLGMGFVERVREQFQRAVDPFGNPWLPLKEITVKLKTERNSPNPRKILEDSGQLFDSFQYEVTEDGLSLFTDRKFSDGTTAEIHQFGGTHPRTQAFIPPREMLPFTDQLPNDWERDIEVALTVGVERIFK